LRLLLLLRHAGRDEGQRIARADVEPHAGVLRAEVRRTVRPRAAAAIAGRRAEHDVLRQILIERAEAVIDPRANGRERAFADMAAGVPRELSAMVVVIGPKRAYDGDVVRAFADVPPPVGDHEARLAVLAIASVEAHECVAIAVRRIAGDDA